MKFWEAMRALEEGKSVRRVDLIDPLTPDRLKDSEYEMDLTTEWELYERPAKTLSLAEALKGLRVGKKFRRKSWRGDLYIGWCPISGFYSQGKGDHFIMLIPTMDLFESTDWIEVL